MSRLCRCMSDSTPLDFLYDNGLPTQLLTQDDDNLKTAKRKLYPFAHMFSRENCSFMAFQDFFSIQYYFTVPPMRVHIRVYAHLRATLPMVAHIKVMQTLRSTLGVVIGRDPGYVPDPPTRFPTGFLHTSSPKDK
eukprot:scaffold396200_cov48-Attheya_sp.AAC.1